MINVYNTYNISEEIYTVLIRYNPSVVGKDYIYKYGFVSH